MRTMIFKLYPEGVIVKQCLGFISPVYLKSSRKERSKQESVPMEKRLHSVAVIS